MVLSEVEIVGDRREILAGLTGLPQRRAIPSARSLETFESEQWRKPEIRRRLGS
jgi:hypothetical protein